MNTVTHFCDLVEWMVLGDWLVILFSTNSVNFPCVGSCVVERRELREVLSCHWRSHVD